MPVYRYRIKNADGTRDSGQIRSPNEQQARQALISPGVIGADITRAWLFEAASFLGQRVVPAIVISLLIGFTVLTAVLVTINETKKYSFYRHLLANGRIAAGTISRQYLEKTARNKRPGYEYTFVDGDGRIQSGIITTDGASSPRRGRYCQKEFGREPAVGMSIEVTYLNGHPERHTPFRMNQKRSRWPLKVLMQFYVVILFVWVVMGLMAFAYVKERRKRHTRNSGQEA